MVTAPDGSQTVVTADGSTAQTEVTELEDGSQLVVATKADGTEKATQVADDGSMVASWTVEDNTFDEGGAEAAAEGAEAPEGADFADGEVPDAPPVPKGLQTDPETGQTTVLLSTGEAVGHTLGEDGVLTLQSTASDPPSGEPPAGEPVDGEPVDGEPVEATPRLAVINPAVGEVITEGDVTLVESTFTETGGMSMEIAPPPGEPDAEPAEVAISADGTQQAITSPTGDSATATTSDTGVLCLLYTSPSPRD